MKHRTPYNQTRRIFAVLRILCEAQAPLTLEEIKDELSFYHIEKDEVGISDRNLQRDIAFLKKELGYDITGGATRGYLLHADNPVLPVLFTKEEVEALLLGRRLFMPFDDTHWGDAIDSLYEKIRTIYHKRSLPNERFDNAELAFIMNPVAQRRWDSEKKEILHTIYRAMQSRSELLLTYSIAKVPEGTPLHVYPHKLIIHKESIYLLALPSRSKKNKKLRLYLIDRIRAVKPTDRTFTPVSTRAFEEMLDNSFGVMIKGPLRTVRIVFTPDMQRYISERIWHPSQKITQVPDGVCLRMEVYVNEELASWICGFGHKAIRVEPKKLAKLVQGG